jgi:hypothetical protein
MREGYEAPIKQGRRLWPKSSINSWVSNVCGENGLATAVEKVTRWWRDKARGHGSIQDGAGVSHVLPCPVVTTLTFDVVRALGAGRAFVLMTYPRIQ